MADAPRESAGVVPLREADAGYEVLWSRRPEGRFLSGFRSFVVGGVDPADASPGEGVSAHRATARREWLEESGWAEDGRDLEVQRLVPIGDWTSPHWAGPVYHTEFFALVLDTDEASGCEARLDPREHADPEWIDPSEAVDRWRRDDVLLSPPILRILQGLKDGPPDAGKTIDGLGGRPSALDAEGFQVSGGHFMLPLRSPTLPPAEYTNSYLVGGQDFVVVDAGSHQQGGRELLLEAVRRRRDRGHRVRGIVATHHHHDHVAGIQHLQEATGLPLWAHPEFDALVDGLTVDRMLEDGDRIGLEDRDLVVLETPGHAPDHLTLFDETAGRAFVGDLVATQGTIIIDPPKGHMGDYLESLRRIRKLGCQVLFPAHGAPVTAPEDHLSYYISHRLNRESKVAAALRTAGRATPEDLVDQVYDDVDEQVWPLAVRSLTAHLIHLAEEDRARYDDGAFVWIDS
jgi:glyoxylase-like metal-dependent hydrolase (beta-lactamase superfamily II)/8-oxo-dGTP pyrophosphatase MutT (NUDIX family)